jgi:hypothetical protein
VKRSRLVFQLSVLALALSVAAIPPIPRAVAANAPKPDVLFSPKPVTIGPVYPGYSSAAESVNVVNVGAGPGAITAVSIAAPFSKAADSCTGATLQSGQSCVVSIGFRPPKKGKFSKALQVSVVTVAGRKEVFKVSVNGTASLSAPTPSPAPTPTPTSTPAQSPTPTATATAPPTPTPGPTPAPTAAPTTTGDVLILGGFASLPVIYDPVLATAYNSGNSFADGASGSLLPENFASVALPDGTVLIAGGDDGTNAYANTYIYNPSAQTVTPVAPMNAARTQFTLTLLNDGTVLAAGGSSIWVNPALQNNSGNPEVLSSAEIYSPITATWTLITSPLEVGRFLHAATLMPNGTVLITGGLTSSGSSYALASDYEIFTPSTSSQLDGGWTATSTSSSPDVARYDHAAVLLDDGSVLLAGGLVPVENGTATTAPGDERYISGIWSSLIRENDQRYDDAAVRLANGDVLIAGGIDGNGDPLDTAEIFSGTGLTWTPTAGTLQSAAYGQAATLMADGRVLIAGGTSPIMETYDRSTNQFTAGGSLPSGGTFNGNGSSAAVIQSAINEMPIGTGPGIATSASSAIQNVPYVSVKVCVHGTTQCRIVNGVILDTGSTGLRLFASKLVGTGFSFVPTSTGQLGECFSFVSGVTWGPVAEADVYMGGQLAKNVPFQIIDDIGSFSAIPSECQDEGFVFSSPTTAGVGFNGVLGVGPAPNDFTTNEYYSCSDGTCASLNSNTISAEILNPANQITANAEGGSSPYYNGIVLSMNSVPEAGQTAAYGSLTFGVGNASDNTPASTVQVFPGNADTGGSILTNFNSSTIAAFLDSGTNGIDFNDSSIAQCSAGDPPNGPWYCPSSPEPLSATIEGESETPTSFQQFTVGNASNLIENGPDTFAMPELAGPFGSQSLFDWGLPFFYGNTIYLVFDSQSARVSSSNVEGPFFAF